MVLLIIMRAILLVCVYKVCNNAWYIINNLSLSILEGLLNIGTIVFRPGLVQGLGPGLWPSRPGQFFFFFKSKRRRFSKKKKQKLTGRNRIFDRVLSGQPGHLRFFLPLFFFNPTWLQPRVDRVPGQPAGPDRVSKLWSEHDNHIYIHQYLKHCYFLKFLLY
jgi:hypothetical protein